MFAQFLSLAVLVAPSSAAPSQKKITPYIQCSMCEHVVGQFIVLSKRHKWGEDDARDAADTFCSAVQNGRPWTQMFDIVEQDGVLTTLHKKGFGFCKKECRVVQSACNKVMKWIEEHLVGIAKISTHAVSVGGDVDVKKAQSMACKQVCEMGKKGKPAGWVDEEWVEDPALKQEETPEEKKDGEPKVAEEPTKDGEDASDSGEEAEEANPEL